MKHSVQLFIKCALLSFIILITVSGCQKKPDAYDNNGNPVYFSQYHGKWVLINYWASWCHPCWQEVPELNALQKQYPNQVKILGVNFDQVDNTKLNELMHKMNIQFTNLTSDPKQKFGVENIPTLPTTIIINPQGKLSTILNGEQTKQSLSASIGLS